MARQTTVQLTEELVALLDQEAGRRRVSRSALIREAVEAYLGGSREVVASRRIVDGYRKVPPATPDGWAGLEALADAGTRETLQRLDEEERRAGTRPW